MYENCTVLCMVDKCPFTDHVGYKGVCNLLIPMDCEL